MLIKQKSKRSSGQRLNNQIASTLNDDKICSPYHQNNKQCLSIQQNTPEKLKIKRTYSILSIDQSKPMPLLIQKAIAYAGREHFAIILVLIAQLLYPTGFLYANQNNINFIETTLARGIAAVLLMYPIVLYYKISIDFKSIKDLKTINTRNIIIVIHSFVYTLSQFYLQQPILQTLNSCGPIFIFVIDYFVNGVKINHKQLVGVFLAVVGVLLTVNGEVLTQYFFNQQLANSQSQFKNYYSKNPLVKVVAGFSLLIAIGLWGYGQVITKRLTTCNFIHVNIHLAFFLSTASGICYPVIVEHPVEISKILGAVLWCGVPTAVASFCFIGAVTISKNTGVLTLFVFTSVIVGYFVSIFRYKQNINILCICGTALLLVGLYKTVINKQKISNQTTQNEAK